MRRYCVPGASIVSALLLSGSLAAVEADSPPAGNWPAPPYWTRTETAPQQEPGRETVGSGRPALVASPAALPFFAVTPCRVADTRAGSGFTGAYGQPALQAQITRGFDIVNSVCGIPATAQAVSFLFTAINMTGAGNLRAFPAGVTMPAVGGAVLVWAAGTTAPTTDAAAAPVGGGVLNLYVNGALGTTADVVLDVNGYYAPSGSVTSLTGGGSTLTGDATLAAGSNVTVTASGQTLTIAAFSGPLLGDVTGSQGATVVSSVGGQTAASVAAGTSLANAATGANTPNAIVRRDGAGSFIANFVTAAGGVLGTSAGSVGVKGVSTSYNGVWAESTSQDALFASGGRDGAFVTGGRHGVGGVSTGSAGILYGVWGSNASPAAGAAGVSGTAGSAPTNFDLSVGDAAGVLGLSFGHIGVAGVGTGFFAPAGKFVSADPATGAAVSVVNLGFGTHAAEFAGNVFVYTFQPGSGNLSVQGTLSKGAGSFKIDHPLDPENKYLYHSFVESPDMMNIYNGNVILDDSGEAIVQLPAYFEALNGDFRYQLTPIGRHAPIFVADEISENRFRIAGGRPGMKVSWQVTGIRKDPFANAHRIIPEVEKEPELKGYYLHADERGQPKEKSLGARAIELKRAEAASGAPDKGR